jgi:hypothetical protein
MPKDANALVALRILAVNAFPTLLLALKCLLYLEISKFSNFWGFASVTVKNQSACKALFSLEKDHAAHSKVSV